MLKAKEILGHHSKNWMSKPMREIKARWGSNGKAWKNVLEGLYIINGNNKYCKGIAEQKTFNLPKLLEDWLA